MNLVEDAWAHAKHCLAHCSQLRSHYGISASDQDVADDIPADANTGIANGVFDRLRLTTTELGRRLERLNEIESAFATWQGRADWWSKQLVVATTAVVGLSSMAAVATVGSRPLAPGMLAVLALLMLVVVACGLGIAVARRSPSVCVGPALARVPDASAMLRMAWRIAAPAAAGLAAARVVSGMV